MKKFTLLFSVFLFLTCLNVKGQGIDSLNYTSTYITVGETWYTDYYTSYSVYNNRSFFKDENDDLHTVFISNYKLNYSFSSDSGNTFNYGRGQWIVGGEFDTIRTSRPSGSNLQSVNGQNTADDYSDVCHICD